MDKNTKYRYEKRISELQEELKNIEHALFEYKQLSLDIFNVITDMVQNDKQINQGWLIKKFKRLFL